LKNEQRLSPARPAGGRKKMGGKRRNASGACTRSLKQKVSGAVNGTLYSKLETDSEGILHHIRMEWRAETMCWLLDVHFSEARQFFRQMTAF